MTVPDLVPPTRRWMAAAKGVAASSAISERMIGNEKRKQ